MPPKCKFTKEQIVEAAVAVTRANGMAGLTARSLAAQLGSSSKPIFGLFQNMEEVQIAVLHSANALYHSYLEKGMAEGKYPPFKASGIAYIQFAKEEKELFKLLFMRNRSGESIEESRDEIRPLLQLIMQDLGIDEDTAYLLHMELWIYVHGIATMMATDYLRWEVEFISQSLTDVYTGLKYRFAGGK